MAPLPYSDNGVVYAAFVHDMTYIIPLHLYYSLYLFDRYTRKCHEPTKWANVDGAYIGAFLGTCKDSISISKLGMITMLVSKKINIFLIFAMLVLMPYSLINGYTDAW